MRSIARSPRRLVAIPCVVATVFLATLLAAVQPAAAAPLTASIAAGSMPTIFTGTANQAAGDWTISVTGAIAVGDTVVVAVDDNDGDPNCAASNDTIGFSSAPTVAVANTATTAPGITAALSSSAGACTTAGVNDTLTLTATSSVASGTTTITLTNVKYTVGSAAGLGDVRVAINGGAFGATGSNATIRNVQASANNPPVLVPSDAAGSTAISPIVLTETSAGALAAGPVCITISNGTFDPSAPPTVDATGGAAVSPPVPPAGPTATFTVTTPSTSPGTYTIAGLKIVPSGDGFILATVGQTPSCDDVVDTPFVVGFAGTLAREAGGTRYGTAQKIVDDGFGCLADVDVVIARGDTFPDALAASYLAGTRGSPILLTDPATVPAETLNALRQHGVQRVTLVGGVTAISTDVENTLKNTAAADCAGTPLLPPANLAVTRISGGDRYETAKNVAEFPGLGNAGTAEPGLDAATADDCGAPVKTAIVASGENFPDALAAGPLAYTGMLGTCPGGGPLPLVLTPAAGVDTSTTAALVDLGIKQVILMGGTSAVTANAATEIAALNSGITVVRKSDTTRQGTAAAIAALEADQLLGGFDGSTVFVCRPDSAPDALGAGPFAGINDSPLLLSDSTTSLGAIASGVIAGWNGAGAPLTRGVAIGGTSALSDAVLAQIGAALASQSPS
jgi:putative cell wall-binding protein